MKKYGYIVPPQSQYDIKNKNNFDIWQLDLQDDSALCFMFSTFLENQSLQSAIVWICGNMCTAQKYIHPTHKSDIIIIDELQVSAMSCQIYNNSLILWQMTAFL